MNVYLFEVDMRLVVSHEPRVAVVAAAERWPRLGVRWEPHNMHLFLEKRLPQKGI